MCSTCGCGQPDDHVKITVPGEKKENQNHEDHHHEDHHHEDHHHEHEHPHNHTHSNRQLDLEKDILYKNNLLAERNRGFFQAKNIVAMNLVSSPGSGKTTFLEKTIQMVSDGPEISIIEGDQQTTNDADRIASTGAKVVQINTGKGCHLDAHMILHAIQKIDISDNSILMIENVGNLVCPAMFDLGEKKRVVVMSVTEGEDKPLKYPDMFMTSNICIINKIDLLPYLEFNLEKAKDYAMKVNPKLTFFEVSATTGEGMDKWIQWLTEQIQ